MRRITLREVQKKLVHSRPHRIVEPGTIDAAVAIVLVAHQRDLELGEPRDHVAHRNPVRNAHVWRSPSVGRLHRRARGGDGADNEVDYPPPCLTRGLAKSLR